MLIDDLTESLLEMVATVRRFPDVDDPQATKIAIAYTWSRVFERTLSIDKAIVNN